MFLVMLLMFKWIIENVPEKKCTEKLVSFKEVRPWNEFKGLLYLALLDWTVK